MAVLINGNGYSPVTAQQDADLFAGIFGDDLVVLNIGSKMEASIESATTVRIADGEAIIEGRRIHIDVGSYDDFTIPTGTQGVTVQYCIGYHFYQDSDSKELCETFVSVYDESLLTPASLRDGATESYITMYIVTQEGITLTGVEATFKIAGNVTRTSATTLYGTINAQSVSTSYTYTSIPAIANWSMIGINLVVNNCRELLTFCRGITDGQLISDRYGSNYIRGGCNVDWTNNRVGIRCTNGSSSTLSTVFIAGVYGIC